MYIYYKTSEGVNNIKEALQGMIANEPDNTQKIIENALLLVFNNDEAKFKLVVEQYKDIIEKNAGDDDGANPFAAIKYAVSNFKDKKGIFNKFVRNGWSAGTFNLNETFFKNFLNEGYAEPSKFDYPKQLKALTEFMLDKGMNIRPLPKVKFIEDDVENARNFFGKTAYYDPNQRVIVLYTMDRHPKDVMRSFAHEMIHHMQNCDNRLGNITTQDTNEGGDLPEIEKEAYEKGNMTFRNWTDTLTEGILKENTEEDDGTLSYESIFKPDINILVAFKNYKNYFQLKPLFDEHGYGFYYPKDKTIIINGEDFIGTDLGFNDMKIVEAHEITHLLLGHTGPYSEEDEMDADLGAYILLTNKGLSTDNLVKEFKNRHGVDFNEELLERVKNRL
jgi:hypothetical protein